VAFTTLSAAGGKDRASERNTAITELRPVSARKTIDESLQNNTLQNDDELFVSLEANATYRITADLINNSGTTPDISFAWSIPSGATGAWTITALVGGALYLGTLTWANTAAIDGTGADNLSQVVGTMVTTNAGTLQLRWAQTTTTASNTTVKANSLLVATRVA
jgi:hypothetical protein